MTATMIAMLPVLLEQEVVITPQTLLQEELDLSSSLVLELLFGIEETHAIQINVEPMDEDKIATVADLAEYIAGHFKRV